MNDAPALRQAEVGIAVSNATDVAKGAASAVLTGEGLSAIVDLVTNGRRIYQRINTWIVNKISRTILKSAFVVLAFLVTGQYVVSASAMLLLVFLNDATKISLSTDNVRWSQKPETWDITSLVKVAALLGVVMVAEGFGLTFVGLRFFGLTAAGAALHMLSFLTMFFFAQFSILVVRERRHFWESRPSRAMMASVIVSLGLGVVIGFYGLPDLPPLPLYQVLAVLGYSFAVSLVLNDYIKYFLVRKLGVRW